MLKNKKKFHKKSVKQQVVQRFLLLALVLSIVFSGINFLTLYVIEDEYFDVRLQEEAQYLKQYWNEYGEWRTPRVSYMSLYMSRADFPDDIVAIAESNPRQREFFGNNERFYHLYLLSEQGPFLLAEVGDQLLVRSKTNTIAIILVVLMVIMLVFALMLGANVGNRILRPLSQLAEHIDHISPESLNIAFKHQYPENEIGKLASAFESAMQRIQRFIKREQHFTRDVSHELRTPIAIMKSSIELMISAENTLTKSQNEHVSRMQTACQQMENVVTTLLSLAREDPSYREQTTGLLPVVERVIADHVHILKHKTFELNIHIDQHCVVNMQEMHLYMLLANIMSNAFQYTVEGEVSVTFLENTLTVSDTGLGIEEGIKAQVFEPLVKGQHSQGFGVGLSLVSRLCEYYGLQLDIKHLTQGTRVSIIFL